MSFSDYYNINSPKARMAQVGQALDALSLGATFNGGTTGGSSNAYTVTISPAPTAYFTGMLVIAKADRANTGSMTLNANSIGAKTCYMTNGATTLIANTVLASNVYIYSYDTTLNAGAGGWHLLNPTIALVTSLTPTISCSGSMTASSTTYYEYSYERIGKFLALAVSVRTTLGGVASGQVYMPLPTEYSYVTHNTNVGYHWAGFENSTTQINSGIAFCDTGARLRFTKRPEANYTLGVAQFQFNGFVQIL